MDLIVRLTPRTGDASSTENGPFTADEIHDIVRAVETAVDDIMFPRTRVRKWEVIIDGSTK